MSKLITELENATDEEILEGSSKLARILTNKILIGVVASVVAHFASDFIIGAIEGKKKAPEITE